MHKSTELLWHKTLDFTPDMQSPNRQDVNPVDYWIWTVIQECIYQKQQQEVKVIWQKAPHGGPIPWLGVKGVEICTIEFLG